MSGEFTYYRKYIILKDNYTNIKGIKPRGHGKLEIRGVKGNMSLNIENCKPHGDYRAYFLRDIAGRIGEYDLGRIIIDERGRTRTNLSFNIRDLEFEGFSIEKLSAILIRKDGMILLNGYIDEDDGTVDRFIEQLSLEEYVEEPVKMEEVSDSKEEMEEVEEYQPIEVEDELPIEELDEMEIVDEMPKEVGEIELGDRSWQADEVLGEVDETEEIDEEGEPWKTDEVIEKADEKEELEEVDEIEEIDEEDEMLEEEQIEVDDIFKGDVEERDEAQGFGEVDEEVDQAADYESLEYMRKLNHKNQMTDYILSILRFFPYVDPFNIYLHGYSWWKIEDSNMDLHKGFLPYYNYLMGTDYRYGISNNHATSMEQIERYGHYIFGIYREGKDIRYYLYGVPGRFTIEEHPFRGVTGFNTWYESEDGLGYWILYIDPMNGKVIQIINPMIPEY